MTAPQSKSRQYRGRAFTLAELLIALVILGVIATFTIPKVLQSQQSSQQKAIVKEAASMLSGAYQAYQAQNTVTTFTEIRNLTPYMNYVNIDTASTYDTEAGQLGPNQCSIWVPCLRLHNGAIVSYYTNNSSANGVGEYFGVLDSHHYLYMRVDPDGKANATTVTDGAGKSVVLELFYNGRISTQGACSPVSDGTYEDGSPVNWCTAGTDPNWFSWN